MNKKINIIKSKINCAIGILRTSGAIPIALRMIDVPALIALISRFLRKVHYFFRKFDKFTFITFSILLKCLSFLTSALTIFIITTSEASNPGTTAAVATVWLTLLAALLLIFPDLWKTIEINKSTTPDKSYHEQYNTISNRIIYSIFFMVLTYVTIIVYLSVIIRHAHQQEHGIAYIYGDVAIFALPFFATVSYMSLQFINFDLIANTSFVDETKIKTEMSKFSSTFMKPLVSYLWIIITVVILLVLNLIVTSNKIPINQGELVSYSSISKFFILLVSWSLFIDFIDKSNKEIENLKSLTKGK